MGLKVLFTVLIGFNIFQESIVQGYDCVKRPKVRYPFCQDRNEARRGHTMCLGGIHQHLMNDTVRQDLKDMHEALRTSVSPPAADMMKMGLNQLLEKEAQIWAEQCKLTHDKEDLRFMSARFTVGQNVAVGGPVLNWTKVIEQWASEKALFKYGGSNNASAVRNYAQMVWAKTYLFGCGVSKCGLHYFYVCNYGPSMTMSEISTPYTVSTSGSWCDSCMGRCDNVTLKQCDCWGKLCLNGGQLNLTTCTCDCINEVNTYDPEFCALKCNSGGDDPKCGKPPYDNSTCRKNSLTDFHCPWMCDLCPYADVNYTESSVLLPWERGLPMCTTSTKSTTARSTIKLTTSTGTSKSTTSLTTAKSTNTARSTITAKSTITTKLKVTSSSKPQTVQHNNAETLEHVLLCSCIVCVLCVTYIVEST